MFGTFLRVERNRLRLDSKDVAHDLHLTDTYYRLVESGRASLNQNLVFQLLALLAEKNMAAGEDVPLFTFERLALFLVGSQWISAEMKRIERFDAANADRLALEELARRSRDFEQFHRQVKNYFSHGEGTETQRNFLEREGAFRVREFLERSDYAIPTRDASVERVMPAAALLELPTLNVEMVRRFLTDLSGRPFVHTPKLASAWEERTAPLIRAVDGVFRDPDLIVHSDNLADFQYSFLLTQEFTRLRFIFLPSSRPRPTEHKFMRLLNKARKAAGLMQIDRPLEKKVAFRVLDKDEANANDSTIQKLFTRGPLEPGSSKYDAYWSFSVAAEIRSGKHMPIGFVGRKGTNSDDIWNLSLEESERKCRQFDKWWDDLETSSR